MLAQHRKALNGKASEKSGLMLNVASKNGRKQMTFQIIFCDLK